MITCSPSLEGKLPHFSALYRWLVIKDYLGIPNRAGLVLDVGCDDGYIIRQMSAQQCVGLDLNPRWRPDFHAYVLRASASQLPLIDGVFDCILAFDVLEHIEDDHATLREMARVMTCQGVILFSTPALGFRMVPGFLTQYANRSFGHRRNGYSPTQIKFLLPQQDNWRMEYFFWNEPFFRAGFVPLHFLSQASPALATRLTMLLYRLDRRLTAGQAGHLFGEIRRCTDPASVGCEEKKVAHSVPVDSKPG